MGGTYWSASRLIWGSSTTGGDQNFDRYRPVQVGNGRFRPSPPTTWRFQPGYGWLQRGKKKQEKEGEPRIVSPFKNEVAARLLETPVVGEPRDDAMDEENLVRRRLLHRGFLIIAFSSSEATRKRGKRQRLLLTRAGRSLGDFSSARGEASVTSHLHGEKKTRLLLSMLSRTKIYVGCSM
ncbi:hypothetical protein B296_00007040 [Ensete ventricosum]|uniref:Uncharacterized protein n=1 Tax=Ensete ventricosum TaxID=4639 RepID=A0A427BAB5_ENSVE|nr:hypothetical protein B296_00007040 [Ensete ventricosum]